MLTREPFDQCRATLVRELQRARKELWQALLAHCLDVQRRGISKAVLPLPRIPRKTPPAGAIRPWHSASAVRA